MLQEGNRLTQNTRSRRSRCDWERVVPYPDKTPLRRFLFLGDMDGPSHTADHTETL